MNKYSGFLCPDELIAKVKAKTAREGCSISEYINLLIEKDVVNEPVPTKSKKKKR